MACYNSFDTEVALLDLFAGNIKAQQVAAASMKFAAPFMSGSVEAVATFNVYTD